MAEGQIRKAIRTGRLSQSLGRHNGRPVIADLELARREWEDNRDPARQRGVGAGSRAHRRAAASGRTIAEERRLLIREQRREKKLRNDALARTLVPAAEVDTRWAAIVLSAKTAWLAVPARARQRIPHLTRDDEAELEALVREVCEMLAREPAPTTGSEPDEPEEEDVA